MKTLLLLPFMATTLVSVHGGLLNGGHFIPTTNVVSSRTIVGGAIGGGPTSGAISSTQYSQTVAAPATVQTIITSHPGTTLGYHGTNSGGTSGGSSGQNNGGNAGGAYANYVYNTGPTGGNGGAQGGGYGTHGGSSGGSQNSGYGSQPGYYNQRYY